MATAGRRMMLTAKRWAGMPRAKLSWRGDSMAADINRPGQSRFLLSIMGVCVSIFLAAGVWAQEATKNNAVYFPNDAFLSLDEGHSDFPMRFSGLLKALNEPVLFNDPSLNYSVRLTIDTAFNGTLIITIAEKTDGHVTAEYKKFGGSLYDSDGAIIPGSQIDSGVFQLGEAQLAELKQLIEDQKFWQLDSNQDLIGSDGSDWVIEVSDQNKFHAAYKWWPSDGGVYVIGQALMKTANVSIIDR